MARATCETYQAAALRIRTLTANSAKQLATDIGYLGDILEDLGHPLSDGLQAVLKLLRLPAKDFWVQSTGIFGKEECSCILFFRSKTAHFWIHISHTLFKVYHRIYKNSNYKFSLFDSVLLWELGNTAA